MEMTLICCSNCGKMAEKPAKEIRRQHKKGNNNFFCNKLCHREYQAKNHSSAWDAVHHRHRYSYLKNNPGPHTCFFCSKIIHGKMQIHHKNKNYLDGSPENLAPSHKTCHTSHHAGENYKIRKVRATGSEIAKKSLGLA